MSQDSDVPWRSLQRDTLKVTAIVVLGVALAGAVPTTVGIGAGVSYGVALAWVVPAVVLAVGGAVVADLVRWRHTRYRVTPQRMELRKGMIMTTRRSLARERIRSVDVSAHPVNRVFGLVRVSVGTGDGRQRSASAAEQTIVLDPVTRAEGEWLRSLLLARPGEQGETGVPAGRPLARWDPAWVRFAPLSFWTLVLAGAAVGGFFQVLNWFGRGRLPVDVTSDAVERFGAGPTLLLSVVVFVAVGTIGSLGFFVEAWWNYRLDREPGGTLRVRRGLLTTRSVSLEEQRIRGVEIVEPLGARTAGAARVDVVTTGLKSDHKTELSTLLPAAPRVLAASVSAAVAGIRPGGRLPPHPRSARTRRLRWALGTNAMLAGALAWVAFGSPLRDFWVGVLAVLAVVCCAGSVALAHDAYRALGHDLDGDFFVARSGSIRRVTVYLQRQGVVGWRVSQSALQRRAGLMTVTATTAAGARRYSVVDADEHEVLDFAADAVPGLLDPFLVRD